MRPVSYLLSPRRIATAVQLLGFSVFTLVISGCAGGTGDVSGKVTYKNEPLPYGSVQFETSAGSFVGDIKADGTYSVSGIPRGAAKVNVTCQDPKYADFMKQLSASARDKSIPKPKGNPEDFNKIPGKYNDFSTSGLTLDVKPGSQTYNIDLK